MRTPVGLVASLDAVLSLPAAPAVLRVARTRLLTSAARYVLEDVLSAHGLRFLKAPYNISVMGAEQSLPARFATSALLCWLVGGGEEEKTRPGEGTGRGTGAPGEARKPGGPGRVAGCASL